MYVFRGSGDSAPSRSNPANGFIRHLDVVKLSMHSETAQIVLLDISRHWNINLEH
jgi:hypothetical protein